MAVGDVYSAYSNNLANDGYLDIRPSGTVEAVIHNIYHGGDVEIYLSDGTNTFKFDEDTGVGVMAWLSYHVKNGVFIRIKNVNGDAQDFGYDGIITHA